MKNKSLEIKAIGTAIMLVFTVFLAFFTPAAVADPTTVTDTYKSDTSDVWWAGANSDHIDGDEYIVPPSGAVWSNAVNCWVHPSWNGYLNPSGLKAKLFAAPSANWIWGPVVAPENKVSLGASYTGDIVFFKKQIDIPDNAFNIQADLLVITADNAYYYYVNDDDWSGDPVGSDGFGAGFGPTNFCYDSYDPMGGAYPPGGGTNSFAYETVGNLYPRNDGVPAVVGYWSSLEQYDITSLLTTGENWLQIVAINEHAPGQGPTSNPAGLIYKVEVTYELATIEKTVTPDNGDLGDTLTVQLDVEVPTAYTMTVEDHLPTFLKYVPGTFFVDTVSVTPTVADGVISTVVGGGVYVITFDVQIIQVEAAEYGEDNWAYLIYNGETVAEDSVWVDTYPYDGFFKRACLIWKEPGDEYIDLNEDVHWLFEITVENTYDYTINNVVVTDRLAAELEIDAVKYVSTGIFTYTTKGNVKMTWTIGDLTPGEEARLVLEISTKMGKKWQEYTSPGTYEINSGAVIKFIGLNDFQHSAHTGQIVFDVPGEWPHVPGTEYCTIYIKYLPDDLAKLKAAWGTPDYYFKYDLWNIDDGYDIENGVYFGWCADEHVYIYLGVTYDTTFYSSYDENLPASASDDEQWDYINYILNNKHQDAAMMDIQSAIWYFADADYPMPTDPEAAAMVNDALANGAGFVPGPGQMMAVICYINPTTQLVFIEVDP